MADARKSSREQDSGTGTALPGQLRSRLSPGNCRDVWQLGQRRAETTRSAREQRHPGQSHARAHASLRTQFSLVFLQGAEGAPREGSCGVARGRSEEALSRTPTSPPRREAAMERITASTTIEELAALVSTTLEAAGISAVLS